MTILLRTKRLIIKAPNPTDFEDLFALQSDKEVMEFVGGGVRSRDQVLYGLEKALLHQEKHGFSLGNVYEKESGAFVGRAGLIYLAYDDTQFDIEIAYALIRKAWGKGYATELASALIDWGFKHLPVKKLVAVIHPKNKRSQNVLKKINMHYVDVRRYGDNEVIFYEITKDRF